MPGGRASWDCGTAGRHSLSARKLASAQKDQGKNEDRGMNFESRLPGPLIHHRSHRTPTEEMKTTSALFLSRLSRSGPSTTAPRSSIHKHIVPEESEEA